jgi:hypothetical protein
MTLYSKIHCVLGTVTIPGHFTAWCIVSRKCFYILLIVILTASPVAGPCTALPMVAAAVMF